MLIPPTRVLIPLLSDSHDPQVGLRGLGFGMLGLGLGLQGFGGLGFRALWT